jgi:hypothetical protein
MARGENTANHPNRKVGRENMQMKAREESLGEASDYDAEAKYAASYRDDPKPSIERDEFNTGDNWSWLKGEFAENYRRGY